MSTTLPATIGGTSYSLVQITEGNYSSEYLTRSEANEVRLKVRHSSEKPTKGAVALDRHNVELSVRTFPTAEKPLGAFDQCYAIIRSDPNGSGSTAAALAVALAEIISGNADALVGWESTLT